MRAVASKRAISKPAVRRLQFLRNAGCDRASALRAGTRAVGAPLMRFQFVGGLKLGEKRLQVRRDILSFLPPINFADQLSNGDCVPHPQGVISRPTFAHAVASRQSTPFPPNAGHHVVFRRALLPQHKVEYCAARRTTPTRAKPIPSPRGLVSVVSPCGVSGSLGCFRFMLVSRWFRMVSRKASQLRPG